MNCNIYRTNSSPLMCLCPFYNLLLYGYTKHKICQWIKLSLVTSHTKCSTSCGLGPFTWADGVKELSYVAKSLTNPFLLLVGVFVCLF